MGKKSLALKLWLVRRNKQNRRVPIFAVARSKRKARVNPKQRNWRRDKLGTRNMRRILGKK